MIRYLVLMAVPISATKAHDLLVREGVRVKKVGEWETHHRNSKGAWGPVNGVMIHHTGPYSSEKGMVDYCRIGDPSRRLPGPLCHGVITKDGTVHLIGWGRSNHAGLGDASVLRAVVAEKKPPKPRFTTIDGNARFYGFECVNAGNGKDPWPKEQVDAMVKAAAALCRAHGWRGGSVIGHKEWTNQKIDPRGIDMDDFRQRVNKILG